MNLTMNNRQEASRGRWIEVVVFRALVLAAGAAFAASAPECQGIPVISGQPPTIRADSGRPLAAVLDGVQRLFLSPVTFEEAPYESTEDLVQIPVVTGGGLKIERSLRSTAPFSVTLGATDTTPNLAVQSVLYAYTNAGLPGVYSPAVRGGTVDVHPVQVRGTDGSMKDITPVMSQPVTFPTATRLGRDTLQLIASQIGVQSGVEVIVLNVPFWPADTLTVGAAGEPARDVISDIGAQIGRPISFQCLWEPNEKRYYLNVTIVAAPVPPGRPAPGGPIFLPMPKLPPSGSPWFNNAPQ